MVSDELTDMQMLHIATETECQTALRASLLLLFSDAFFYANKARYRQNPANTLHYRALHDMHELAIHDIGEQIKRLLDNHPAKALPHAKDLVDHRHYIAHHKMKTSNWDKPRMQIFADEGRGEADFKPSMVWKFWTALVQAIDQDANSSTIYKVKQPSIDVSPEMVTMAQTILQYSLKPDESKISFSDEWVQENLRRFQPEFIDYCTTTNPVRKLERWTDEERDAFMAARREEAARQQNEANVRQK